jgi:hypothetical protein
MIPFQFIGPAYTGRSENYSSQRTVNYYLESGKGKAPGLLIGTPGLTAPWATLTGGGMRGMLLFNVSTAIMVCGTKVFALTTAGVSTQIGTIADDGRPVQMASNGVVIAIASANVLYSVTPTGTAETYIRSDVSSVDFIDGYFTITETSSGRFYVSGQYATTIDPLDFATAEGLPDNLLTHIVSRRQVYLYGTQSVEQWYNSGNSDFPLSRIDGAFVEIGIVAKDSLSELDNPFWLGGDDKGAGAVWTMNSGTPQRISTPAIEYAIAQWPDMSDAEAFCYSQEGHSFYVLSSASGNETWVFDVATGEWHQRAYLHASGDLHRIRPRCHLYFGGKNLVGDWENGNVYEYDLDTYSDNGNPLPAIRACGIVQSNLDNQPVASLRLDIDAGVGLTTGQGSDPQAMLRWSRDGGKLWSNALWRTMGRIGEYGRRCIWRRVGGGERMVFEVTITDPVKRNITGAYLE